ncbi:MAG: recombinase family protein [Clostridia bacterium]|nr:recombinase family protein [Clostridia bacterium]
MKKKVLCTALAVTMLLTTTASATAKPWWLTDEETKIRNEILLEKENLNTLEVSSEFLLSMYSTFAQQESESQSLNVKMGKRYRYSQGHACLNFNRVYGYGQDGEKNIYIVPEQTAAVKVIFAGFQRGLSMREIADSLIEEKIPSPSGKPVWKTEAVKRILVNEKYAGDVLTQKTYVVDPISKKTGKILIRVKPFKTA